MDLQLKDKFLTLWNKYFGIAELPISFFFGHNDGTATKVVTNKKWSCIICELSQVRRGQSLAFDEQAVLCGGAKRFLGYTDTIRPEFEYFLSCGIPGKLEGERYIRTPEMVLELVKKQVTLPSKGKEIIFKRWDKLSANDNPEVIIFFATPDVLSGLFTLANFDQTRSDSTIAPFGSGCATAIHYPYLEKDKENPSAVIGMFDPSARKCVPADQLTFAVPFKKMVTMIDLMEESFLTTPTWETVKKRINRTTI